ncbi:MAG TPA: hypothetical protein VGM26_16545 [Rhizomicrobium sp.]|jgi:hypothetical protein
MTDGLPLTHSYNLARLGNAGDEVTFAADDDQRAAIARWSGVLSVEALSVTVDVKKLAATRFGLTFDLTVDVTQACVVSLEPVAAHTVRQFTRELNFVGPARRKLVTDESGPDLVLDGTEEEGPEEIESLHYDLAGPVLEEYVLSLEPYPRSPGVEFRAQTDALDQPESPFAVLKGLK